MLVERVPESKMTFCFVTLVDQIYIFWLKNEWPSLISFFSFFLFQNIHGGLVVGQNNCTPRMNSDTWSVHHIKEIIFNIRLKVKHEHVYSVYPGLSAAIAPNSTSRTKKRCLNTFFFVWSAPGSEKDLWPVRCPPDGSESPAGASVSSPREGPPWEKILGLKRIFANLSQHFLHMRGRKTPIFCSMLVNPMLCMQYDSEFWNADIPPGPWPVSITSRPIGGYAVLYFRRPQQNDRWQAVDRQFLSRRFAPTRPQSGTAPRSRHLLRR